MAPPPGGRRFEGRPGGGTPWTNQMGTSHMKKKIIGILAAAGLVLGLGLVVCSRMLPGEYVPAADEIALKIQFDTAEDVGLLVYDYQADGHEYSGGISNVDGSLIRRDSENIVVWDRAELAPRAEPLSCRYDSGS